MLNKLTDRVYYMQYDNEKNRSIIGLVVGDDSSLVIDGGSSKAQADEFIKLIKNMDIPPLRYLALTHGHENHVVGAYEWNLINVLNGMTNEKIKKYNFEKEIKADIIYDEFLKVDLGNVVVELERIPSDHSRDCSIVHIPSEKIVFLGDILYSNRKEKEKCYTNELMIPLLKELQCYEADYYIPSHDSIIDNAKFSTHSELVIKVAKCTKNTNDFDVALAKAKEKVAITPEIEEYIHAFLRGNIKNND